MHGYINLETANNEVYISYNIIQVIIDLSNTSSLYIITLIYSYTTIILIYNINYITIELKYNTVYNQDKNTLASNKKITFTCSVYHMHN